MSAAALRAYFQARAGRALSWSFEGERPRSHRREYSLLVQGVEGNLLLAEASSHDFDRGGARLSRVPNRHGPCRIALEGPGNPLEAIEAAARAADPAYFEGLPPRRAKAEAEGEAARGAGALGAEIERRLRDLAAGTRAGEQPPLPASADRLRAFCAANPGLVPPDLFTAADGTIRARWQDGPQKLLWVGFPPGGPAVMSVHVPREGDYGLRKLLNARCPHDADVPGWAALLGVRCTR